MTVAVCLKCGALKHGAWTPCPKCKHTPQDPEDKARHLITSDHYFGKADLEGISARVQSGLPLTFDPKQIEEAADAVKTIGSPDKSVRLFVFIFFAVVLGAILGSVYLIVRFILN
jgi:hypothetical protein